MESRKTVIIGAGGFAKEVYEVFTKVSNWNKDDNSQFLGFLDDNETLHGTEFMGSRVIGGIDWLSDNPKTEIILGIGSPHIKRKIIDKISKIGNFKYPTLIDPNAILGDDVRVGDGVFIGAGTIITTNIDIKDYVTINLSCTIGHDSVLESFVTVAPGVNISGNCNLNEGVDFGTNATIIQGKSVSEWSIVGAGSVVVKDIPSNVTVVGNPSKVIKEREVGWHL